jgi:hypothetical protein
MPRRKIRLTHPKQRSVLTDMLPFEVPPTFSNRGFYRFIRDCNLEITDGYIKWECKNSALDAVMYLLFGIKDSAQIKQENVTEWGKAKRRRIVATKDCLMNTIPFNFKVAHKLDGRILSVIHPRNQAEVANFYARHKALIIYYASRSEFSIRHPVSISRYTYFADKLHELKLETMPEGIEEEDKEYEQIGSYFVYRKYRNIHKFFESYHYHQCEKKYDAMVQIDVSKCFDSIYTHSIAWAILGKDQAKFHLTISPKTFPDRFDGLMRRLNYGETNGIVIGPEFSRIFAEIILQSVDIDFANRLRINENMEHKINYEIFRYVDDYFVFYNNSSNQLKIIESLQESLKATKLNINTAKIRFYEKPIITEITLAKDRISSILNQTMDANTDVIPSADASRQPVKRLSCLINVNRLIIQYKAAIKESKVEYADLLNYTFAIAENKIGNLLKSFNECDKTNQDKQKLLNAMQHIMEFAFFAYSASPKVNHTIRICRMISTCVLFLNKNAFPYDLKHLFFKAVHDNILQQIDKNAMNVHREIETLYLLISLSPIGKDYWLPQSSLAKYFQIREKDNSEDYDRNGFMNHFSITVLLSYIKYKKRYDKLRQFVERHVVEKLEHEKAHCPNHAESLILFLDLLVCPYIKAETKEALGTIFGLDQAKVAVVQASNDYWFTAWGEKFDLAKELDSKRSREVY